MPTLVPTNIGRVSRRFPYSARRIFSARTGHDRIYTVERIFYQKDEPADKGPFYKRINVHV